MAQASGVTLKVLSSNGMHGSLAALAPQFERASGHRLDITYDTGVGFGERVARGERPDVGIITVQIIAALAQQGITAAPRLLARSGVGVGVRAGAARPDVSSVAALTRALLAAPSVTFTKKGASGIHFAGVIEQLGIADAVRAKAVTPDGGLVGELLVAGRAELAVQQVSELVAVPGVHLVGPLPPEVQLYTEVAATVFAGSARAAAAQEFVEFLASAGARAVYRDKGMETA